MERDAFYFLTLQVAQGGSRGAFPPCSSTVFMLFLPKALPSVPAVPAVLVIFPLLVLPLLALFIPGYLRGDVVKELG